MYGHSDGAILDNGVGYLSEFENIQCNNDIDFRNDAVWFNESAATVRRSIIDQYLDLVNEYPCGGVSVRCGDYNGSCEMT